MSVTYTGGTVKVVGGTKLEPITWEDVYSADVLGSWDVLEDLDNGIWRRDSLFSIGGMLAS